MLSNNAKLEVELEMRQWKLFEKSFDYIEEAKEAVHLLFSGDEIIETRIDTDPDGRYIVWYRN